MQSLSEQELLNYAIVDIRDPSVLDQLYRDGLLNEGLHVEASLMLARHHHVQIGLSDTPVSSARFTSIKRRVGGGIQAAVGTLEIGAASLMMFAPAPGARIVAGVVGANGALNAKAGWQTATTGVVHRTDFSKSVTRLAVSSGIDAYSAQRLGDYGQFSLDVGTGVAMSTVRVANAPQTGYSALDDGGVERILGLAPISVGRSELGNALSGLGSNPLGRNLNTLDEFGSGSAFSGVFDPASGKFLAYPSGSTRLANGADPLNLVPRRGGHSMVNDVLSGLTGSNPRNNLGFTMFLDDAGDISVDFFSRGVNGRNPAFNGNVVPENMRQQILDAIRNLTDRNVTGS